MNTITIPSQIVKQLEELFLSAPLEAAGLLFCRQVGNAYGTRLLASEFRAYSEDDYLVREFDRLTISPISVNAMLNFARDHQLSVVQVHTHPGSDDARFSPIDDAGEREMMPVVFRRVPGRLHGTLVLGHETWSGRIYASAETHAEARIVDLGEKVRRLDAVTKNRDERFSRSALAFGEAGQAALQDLRVGIVGLGGTGSIAAQQISFLGVRDVVFIDPEPVDATNLNRLVGTTPNDVSVYKVDVAARSYECVLPGAAIRKCIGDVLDEEIARDLLDRDIILCCTDSQASRDLLNMLAYQMFLPVIDMGVEITVSEGAIIAVSGRVQAVGPSMPCLHCCNVINLEALRVELLTEEQRAADPYVTGEHVDQPAVISLNGTIVSLAITMFMAMATTLPMAARMQTYYGLRGEVRSAMASSKVDCWICSSASVIFGRGETLAPTWRAAGGSA